MTDYECKQCGAMLAEFSHLCYDCRQEVEEEHDDEEADRCRDNFRDNNKG